MGNTKTSIINLLDNIRIDKLINKLESLYNENKKDDNELIVKISEDNIFGYHQIFIEEEVKVEQSDKTIDISYLFMNRNLSDTISELKKLKNKNTYINYNDDYDNFEYSIDLYNMTQWKKNE